MLPEAELFRQAEPMLVEVLGRIRDADLGIVVPAPPDLPGEPGDLPLGVLVEQYAYDELGVPVVLRGGAADTADRAAFGRELAGAGRQSTVERVAAAAAAAAATVGDGDAVVRPRYGALPAWAYLLRLTVNRALLAHYVAAYLGSTACPLPEELARPLWERTRDDAAAWRALGIFRTPLAVPPLASWRDTFLRTAGHEPHPLGH